MKNETFNQILQAGIKANSEHYSPLKKNSQKTRENSDIEVILRINESNSPKKLWDIEFTTENTRKRPF
jgi:hypothetical protein